MNNLTVGMNNLTVGMNNLTVGNKYTLKFVDNEGSDRIEPEFAPVYNGQYVCAKLFTLPFEGDFYVPGSTIHIAKMERVSDNVIVNVIHNGMGIVTPIYETHDYKFNPMIINDGENANANMLDEHYDYARCNIEV